MKRIFASLAGILFGVGVGTAAAQQTGLSEELARPVRLMTLEQTDTAISRVFYGRVAARSTVDLAFQVGGQIERLIVLEGQTVPSGTLLGQLELVPFDRDVAEARTELEQANADLRRAESLGPNVVSQSQIDTVRTSARLAQIALDEAEDQLTWASLVAPFDALVAQRHVEPFSNVSAGTPVLRLHDMSELRVNIAVPEVLFREVGADPHYVATANRLGRNEEMQLAFREITAEASEFGQTYAISFVVVGGVPENLLPGASVAVTITLYPPEGFLGPVVPASAITYTAAGAPQVLVFEAFEGSEIGRLEARPVALMSLGDGRFRLNEGPDSGVEIVAAGAARLKGGETVRRYVGLLRDGASE
ncbi:efflux RND transporter periplasmic adaptor subunit [Salipiger abyssi]|uniref:efflux RND transporter periplasmic adaptor subunit n=1 Tax=Salipiger abyssi TaxID=1250539 RepID=UPI0009763313|nr:efflux RND transporter periplasmic adaptor subunit [Salipiger abyssi]